MDVELFRTGPPTGYGSFAADGVARVQVGGPVEAALKLDGGAFPGLTARGPANADAAELAAAQPQPDQQPGEEPPGPPGPPVRISATGPFAFDPHANTARFLSARGEPAGVRVWHDAPADPNAIAAGPDELTCRTLTVRLEPGTPAARAEAAAVRADRGRRTWGDRSFFAADDDLAPVLVLAEGTADRPVRVLSPGRGVTIFAGRLSHDLPADALTLDSANGANGGTVTVRAPDAFVRCPRLTVLPPDPAAPGGPRRLSADGPGELRRADPATGELAATVSWPGDAPHRDRTPAPAGTWSPSPAARTPPATPTATPPPPTR